MKKSLIYSLLGVVFMFCACEDFFESTVSIDPPEPEDLMFVSSTIGIGDSVIHASVTRTVSIANLNDPINSSILSDADVRIRKEGSGEEVVLEYSELGQTPVFYHADIPEGFYVPGENYTFSAEHASYPRAYITESFPEKVEIAEISFEEDGGVNEEGYERSRISFSFQDPPGKQFYEVLIIEQSLHPTHPQYNTTYSDSTDPSVSRGAIYHSNIIDDNLFDGEYKTIALRIHNQSKEEAKKRLNVRLRNVSESYYRFSKTKFARDEFGDDNPFQSPVQLYSNVNDGLGIIAFYAEDFEKY